MNFFTYEITSAALRPYIKFILFNYCDDPAYKKTITYFPNTDVCLGLIHQQQITQRKEGFFLQRSTNTVNAYLSGIYKKPHRLHIQGQIDEICLPFTPLGYFHFFPAPLQPYVLDSEILAEALGRSAPLFFEQIFREKNIQKRGVAIEKFLLKKWKRFDDALLQQSFYFLHQAAVPLSLQDLSCKLNCSHKKLQRKFGGQLNILPKEYLQILQFRRALSYMGERQGKKLTDVCFEADYYDQSHFIRNIYRYTDKKPSDLQSRLRNIDNKVLISLC